MAPLNEDTQVLPDFFQNVHEELKKSLDSITENSIQYPCEKNIEETDEQVKVSLALGNFKHQDVKVTLQDDLYLSIEGSMKTENEAEYNFYKTFQLPYPCNPENIETGYNEIEETFNISLQKDKERYEEILKEREETKQKIQEALAKFEEMKPSKPISLKDFEEDETSCTIKLDLGEDHADDNISVYLNGPHDLIIESVQDGAVRRKSYKQLYIDSPCDINQEVKFQKDGTEMTINVSKDINAIKAYEEFQKQMEPMEALFNSQEEKITNNDKEYAIEIDVGNFAPEEVQVTATEDNVIQIEAKHESQDDGPSFSLYREFWLPEDCSKENMKHFVENGKLVISAPKAVNQPLRQG